MKRLPGYVLLSASCIAYLGVSDAQFRQESVRRWLELIEECHIRIVCRVSIRNVPIHRNPFEFTEIRNLKQGLKWVTDVYIEGHAISH